jgi:ABC-type branched-subunit amino acid transport system ATPase component
VLGDVTGLNFDPFNSLVYVATLMIAVGGAPWYALLAAVPLALGPVYITASGTLNYLVVTFGASVVIVALRGQMRWGWAERAIDRLFGNANAKTLRRSNRSTKRMPKPTTRENIDVSPMKLVANNIVVRYGGLVAVSDCSFEATSGLITGLIGPNGAGKTSALNVCSGLVRARSGQVCLDGRDIGGLSLAARARLGIGRSFQQIELFETLTVRENLVLGSEGCIAGRSVIRQAVTMPAQRRTIEDRVAEAADRTSLTQLLDVQVGALSTGQRRLVEFGRCLAGSYRMILLDEPSSGLDHMETAAFGRILKAAVRDRNLGVLLVEHDISLVMTVCDVIYVMDFGSILFRGSPAEVRASEAVRTAYLGESSSDSSFSNALEYEQGYGVK